MLPVATIKPAVPRLPTLALPVAVIAVTLAFVAPMLPTLALPVTVSAPPVTRLPPVTLPVAVTVPADTLAVVPENTVCAPSGLVKIKEVALAEICALPRYMVELDNHMSRHLWLVDPRS